ncbi:EAL domain, c-di-GMP-specific phosphodiesterase class I (or its enzymatically inactive variant) [Ruminococcaceae bacterium YRB3002]|nr:EAL domain, c-di-GMP-specific phosphodiesterase class I (or its enzymatically inactive variant) [Ruminococcaceae bacterium YRB3002]
MAKYNRKKITKLRKSHIGLSIFALIAISTLGVLMMLILADFALTFLINTKAETDAGRLKSMVDAYDTQVKTGDGDVFGLFDMQEVDYFVTDDTGNIIHSNGENTCDMTRSVDYSDLTVVGQDSYHQIKIYSDRNSGILNPVLIISSEVSARQTISSLLEIMNDEITDKDESSIVKYEIDNGMVSMPYWMCSNTIDGKIFYKGGLTVNSSDLAFIVLILSTLAILVVIIVVALFINVIVNFVDQQRMKKLLFMDNVTQNHNWIRFYLEAGELLEKRKNANKKYAVVNLVFVKYRNFVLCHSVAEGEMELRKTYNKIREHLDRKELCGHDNSSSFALLLMYDDINALRDRIQKLIDELSCINDHHTFGFQAGVELIPASHRRRVYVDVDALYNNACAARMTLAGTDESGIAFFDQKIVEDHKWIDRVHEHQQKALENKEFVVYYQPKYDPRTNKLSGAEALIRWKSADLGFVSPGDFIPIFEENGFITEIDHYMIEHVALDQKAWLDQGLSCVPVSVNVSRAHFIEEDLADQIRDIVAGAGCPPELIEIELTESAFFDNKAVMLRTIGLLKEYGFAVSMDDFGSGYSSLNSLKDLPLDVLKLDAGFFRDITDDSRGEIVVSEAIRLAKNLNMKTVAEGVEEREQVDFLAKEGCDMIQGYYYAKPMPGEEYISRMEKRESEDEGSGEDT